MKVVQENKRQFLQKVQSLWRQQIYVYIDEEFAINRFQTKFLGLLLTGKFFVEACQKGFISKEYSQAVNIQLFSGCA